MASLNKGRKEEGISDRGQMTPSVVGAKTLESHGLRLLEFIQLNKFELPLLSHWSSYIGPDIADATATMDRE